MRSLFLVLALIGLFSCQKPTYDVVRAEYYVVDSTWIIPSGTRSTLQFDPLYGYKTGNRISYRKEKTAVGDTITFLYIKRVE